MAEGNAPRTWNNSGEGYLITPEGILIQWGKFTVSVSAGSYAEYTVNYPKPFSADKSCVVATPKIWSDPKYFSVIVKELYQTSVGFRVANTSTAGSNTIKVCWIAIGKES